MLAILSPAKSLDTTPPERMPERTTPVLAADTAVLLKVMKRKSPRALKSLMGISDKLAELNHARYQEMVVPLPEESLPAAMLFAGDVYRGLDARSLGDADLEWAQNHVGILSGLYGLLRPLDRTHPYRLEMGTRLTTRRGKSLYAFWGNRIAKQLDARLATHPDGAVIDLASGEYSKAVDRKALKADWIDIAFKEIRDGKPRVISFFAKHARGRMARWLVERRIETRDRLSEFDCDGYAYDPALSSEGSLVFTRSSST